jgi:hypothetical protein
MLLLLPGLAGIFMKLKLFLLSVWLKVNYLCSDDFKKIMQSILFRDQYGLSLSLYTHTHTHTHRERRVSSQCETLGPVRWNTAPQVAHAWPLAAVFRLTDGNRGRGETVKIPQGSGGLLPAFLSHHW